MPKLVRLFTMQPTHDVILIGCGCSSLQWLSRFMDTESAEQHQVLILDKNETPPDRTWCFWSKKAHGYEHLVSYSWSKIRFASRFGEVSHNIAPYSYQYISGRDFFAAADEGLLKQPNITRLTDEAAATQRVNGHTSVETTSGQFSAGRVLSSVPDPAKILQNGDPKPLSKLWQHFRGWFIKTSEAAFDPEEVVLMDFRTPQTAGAVFFYVLPFSEDYALVECTVFGEQLWDLFAYEEALRTYISTYITAEPYEVVNTEEGRIPMSQQDFRKLGFDGTEPLGTAAGLVKPSTGYMFLRSLRDVESRFAENPKAAVSPRFAFYDGLLLGIIEHEPEQVAGIMTALFTRNPIQRVFRFLDEESSLAEEIRMFATLPWAPFLKQLAKQTFQSKNPDS